MYKKCIYSEVTRFLYITIFRMILAIAIDMEVPQM